MAFFSCFNLRKITVSFFLQQCSLKSLKVCEFEEIWLPFIFINTTFPPSPKPKILHKNIAASGVMTNQG